MTALLQKITKAKSGASIIVFTICIYTKNINESLCNVSHFLTESKAESIINYTLHAASQI